MVYAELFEEAFYKKKNVNPQIHEMKEGKVVDVPEEVDAELLAKVLANPEMVALLASLAKTINIYLFPGLFFGGMIILYVQYCILQML